MGGGGGGTLHISSLAFGLLFRAQELCGSRGGRPGWVRPKHRKGSEDNSLISGLWTESNIQHEFDPSYLRVHVSQYPLTKLAHAKIISSSRALS